MNATATAMLDETSTNRLRRSSVEAALAEVLSAALRRGFYGTCAVELSVNDGTIQHIRRRVEQVEQA